MNLTVRPNDYQGYTVTVYQKVLNRTPSLAEQMQWVQFLIEHVVTPVTDSNFLANATPALEEMGDFFWRSPEHRRLQIHGYYQQFFNRNETAQENNGWVVAMVSGGYDEQAVQQAMIASSEYSRLRPTDTQFINSLYMNLYKRTESDAQRAVWLAVLLRGEMGLPLGETRGQVGLEFLVTDEEFTHVINDAIDGYYMMFLNRLAESDAVVSSWVNLFKAGSTREAVASMFLGLQEFYGLAIRNDP
jgi:hypothetical protein